MTKFTIFFWQSMGTHNDNLSRFGVILQPCKTKNHIKKFATLAAKAFFVCAISLLFAPKQPFMTI
jgi:hypothetical protein